MKLDDEIQVLACANCQKFARDLPKMPYLKALELSLPKARNFALVKQSFSGDQTLELCKV